MRATAADPEGVCIEGECGGGVIEPRLAGFWVGAIVQPERGGGMAEVLNALPSQSAFLRTARFQFGRSSVRRWAT